MSHNNRFAVPDLFLLAGILIVVLSLTVAGCGSGISKEEAVNLQKGLRSIHSGCILFAQGNKDYYPGLDSNGALDTRPLPAAASAMYGTTSASGTEPVYRYAVLLRGNYFPPVATVSPADKKAKQEPKVGVNLTTAHFSFAMLQINPAASNGRTGEWKSTNSSRPAIISDRNIGSGAGAAARSNLDSGKWVGFVCHNDNHVSFNESSVLKTEYSLKGEIAADDLFADDNDSKGQPGNDAAMVYQDATTYVNQK